MSETGIGSTATDRADQSGLYDQAGNLIGGGRPQRDLDGVTGRHQPSWECGRPSE